MPTLDEKAWRATEPHTPHPRARLEAVAELNRPGIPCGILIAPLMPGVNDSPEQVEQILELAAEAGAVSVGGIALHLRGEVRRILFDWLRSAPAGPASRATSASTRAAPTSPGRRGADRRLIATARARRRREALPRWRPSERPAEAEPAPASQQALL